MVAASPTALGRAALGYLPARRFSRIFLAVSATLVLIIIIHAHFSSLSPSQIQERIQSTWGTVRPTPQNQQNGQRPHSDKPHGGQHKPHSDPVDDTYNSTLGFEKVFYISMPQSVTLLTSPEISRCGQD
jgi:hypothetical protein